MSAVATPADDWIAEVLRRAEEVRRKAEKHLQERPPKVKVDAAQLLKPVAGDKR